MILYAFLPIYLALLYRIKTVYLSFMDFCSYQLRFISLNTHRQAMLFLLSFVVVSNLACLACPILKLHAKCALKRTIQKFTKTKPSVSSFVVAIKYAHIRDLRHTKRVVQACRASVSWACFQLYRGASRIFSKRGLWVWEFKATVPGPKKWGRGRGRVMFEYVDFLHFDFRGINLSNVRRYIKD